MIIACQEQMWKRKIQEAVEIKTKAPTLNRDAGYDLPTIFDKLLSHDRPKKGGHVTGEERLHRIADEEVENYLASYDGFHNRF